MSPYTEPTVHVKLAALSADSGMISLVAVLLSAAFLTVVELIPAADGATASCAGSGEDADDATFAEACELQTSLLQTSSKWRMVPRPVGRDAVPVSSLLRLESRRTNKTRSHAALLDADAKSKIRALRADAADMLRYGPYGTERVRAHVGGYDGCGTFQHADVYYPVARGESGEPGQVPLISFAHGLQMGGPGVGPNHGSLLPFLTSWGFVVVAQESELHRDPDTSPSAAAIAQERPGRLQDGRVLMFCNEATADQIRSLEWASGSEIAERIDWAAQTGVAGYSMGATATVLTAGNAEAVSRLNIGAAFALAPYFGEVPSEELPMAGWIPLEVAPVTHTPLFLATGALDATCPAEDSRDLLDAIGIADETRAPRLFASLAAANHQMVLFEEVYHTYAAALFRCHLRSHDDSCNLLYGEATEPCNGMGFEPCAVSDNTKFTAVRIQGGFD